VRRAHAGRKKAGREETWVDLGRGVSCFPFYPIETIILVLFRVHAHAHVHHLILLVNTYIHTLLNSHWTSTKHSQTSKVDKHLHHPSPHASGLKVSCRRSHHHQLRRALLACLFDRLRLNRELWIALEIDGNTHI